MVGIVLETLLGNPLCDAALADAPIDADYIDVAISARPLPGDGIVDIPAVLNILKDNGADPYFVMEVYNDDLRELGPGAMARAVQGAAGRLFAHA